MFKKLLFSSSVNVSERDKTSKDIPLKKTPSELSLQSVSDLDITKTNKVKENKYSANVQKTAKVVEMKILKLRVSYVNMTEEQLDADIFLNFTWKTEKNKKDTWKPQFYIENMVREYRERSEITQTRMGKGDEFVVSQDIHVAGTFSIPMNWKYYPFDSHRLKFTILSRLNPDDVYLTMDLIDNNNLVYGAVENDDLNNEEFTFSEMIRCGRIFDLESKVLGMFIEILAMRRRATFGIFYFPLEFFVAMIPVITLMDNSSPQQKITACFLSMCLSVFLKNLIFAPSPTFMICAIDIYHLGSLCGHCAILFYITISNITGELRFIDFINRMKKLNDHRAAILYLIILIVINIAFCYWIRKQPYKNPKVIFSNKDEDSDIYRESSIFY